MKFVIVREERKSQIKPLLKYMGRKGTYMVEKVLSAIGSDAF